MLRFALLHVFFLVLSVLPAGAAGPPVTAGRVDFVVGDTWFVDASQQKRRPARGDPLFASDTVVTGKNGEVHLDMEDGGYLAVRSNTLLKVEEYRARGNKDDRCILNLIKGTFRSFTGWIPRVAPGADSTSTITATIGVRGTDHEPLFIPEGSDLGKPGTYDKVNEGATFIVHASGRIEVTPNTAGFAPLDPRATARLLERVPDFFRPSANENLLAGRHKIVQDRLEQRLEERRRLNKLESPEKAPSGELQETPLEPNAATGVHEAPVSSTVPGVPIAPASAVVPTAPAAAASAALPATPAPAASAVAPAAPAAAAAAVAPAIPAAAAAAVVTSKAVAPASAVTSPPIAAPSIPAASSSTILPSAPAASPSAAARSAPPATPPPAAAPKDGRPSRPNRT